MKNNLEKIGTIALLKDINYDISLELQNVSRELKRDDKLDITKLVDLVNNFCGQLASLESTEYPKKGKKDLYVL